MNDEIKQAYAVVLMDIADVQVEDDITSICVPYFYKELAKRTLKLHDVQSTEGNSEALAMFFIRTADCKKIEELYLLTQ